METEIDILDKKAAARLKHFRKDLINKSQLEVEAETTISQSNLSKMELGTRGINFYTIKKLTDAYDLNFKWLSTGEGNPFLSNEEIERQFDIVTISVQLNQLEVTVRMLQKTQSHLLDRIAKLEEENAGLKSKK